MSKSVFVVVLAAAVAGIAGPSCKKEKGPDSPGDGGAYARKDTTALWKMVPKRAMAAVVVSDGTLAHAMRGFHRVIADFRKTDNGGKIFEKERRNSKEFEEIVLTPGGEAKVGVDLSKGGLAYILDNEDFVLVLPVSDPAKAVELAKATKDGEFDNYKNDAFCKPHQGYYACAPKKELIATLGEGGGMAPPSGDMRGHVEVFVNESLGKGMSLPPMIMSGFSGMRVGATFDPGGVTVRTTIESDIPQKFHTSGKPRLLSDVAGKSPTGLSTVRMGSMLAELRGSIPPEVLNDEGPGGITPGQLLDALDGDAAGYGLPDSPANVVRIGIKNPEPFEKLLSLCALMPPKIGTAKLENNRCNFTITPPGFIAFSGAVWVEDKTVQIGFGDFESKRENPPALRRMGKEIIDGEWAFASWGYGGLFSADTTPFAQLPEFTEAVNATKDKEVQVGLWAMLHVAELGLALRADDKGMHALIRLRTTWSNPKEVSDALDAIFQKMSRGDFNQRAAITELAKKHPNSPLAADMRSGGGAAVPAAVVGAMAAVAIPAFMKYIGKSKTSEARQFVKKMSDGARVYAMDARPGTGLTPAAPSFPKESTPVTPPAGSCCKNGGEKCYPEASLWTHPTWVALQFSVDDPHYYSYQYEVADDGKKFTVRAIGDLDCDGDFSTFEMYGQLNADGMPEASPNMYRENELE